jgi:hypothetical protein
VESGLMLHALKFEEGLMPFPAVAISAIALN